MLSALAVLLAALCFATTGTAQALAGVDASPVAVGAARILVGGGILGVMALVQWHRTPPEVAAVTVTSRVPSWVIVGCGALGVLAYQPAFFAGTRLNGVAIGTVVALGSAPIVTGVLESIVRRRRPTGRWMVATTIALVGVVLVSGLGSGDTGGISVLGLLFSLTAGASYAVYALVGKLLLDRGWSSTAAMGSEFGVAAAVSLPLLLVSGVSWLATPRGLTLALWLGVVTTAVGYLLFGWGLKRLSATTVATLTLAEPLGATLLGLLVLHETLGTAAAFGLVIIAAGLALLTMPTRTRRPDHVPLPA